MDLKGAIEEAQRRVAICRSIAARPGATIEDELSLQHARCWLLALENRVLRRIAGLQRKLNKQPKPPVRRKGRGKTAKERAADAFAQITRDGV